MLLPSGSNLSCFIHPASVHANWLTIKALPLSGPLISVWQTKSWTYGGKRYSSFAVPFFVESFFMYHVLDLLYDSALCYCLLGRSCVITSYVQSTTLQQGFQWLLACSVSDHSFCGYVNEPWKCLHKIQEIWRTSTRELWVANTLRSRQDITRRRSRGRFPPANLKMPNPVCCWWVSDGKVISSQAWSGVYWPWNRSGKSSIASVVFHKMPPNETLFLESTTRIQKDSIQ